MLQMKEKSENTRAVDVWGKMDGKATKQAKEILHIVKQWG